MVDLFVDLSARADRTTAVYHALRAAIADGRLRPGDRLPATRVMAADLSIARSTVATAYERLCAEGYLVGRVGAGTFVTSAAAPPGPPPPRRPSPLRPRPAWDLVAAPTGSERPRVDFRVGIADPGLFPFDTWRRLVADELRPRGLPTAGYADPAGHPRLRAALARHLAQTRSVRAGDDLVITNGTQHGIDLVARVLVAPGEVVAVEDPGYPQAARLFLAAGARVVGVPVDAEGLLVDRLPAAARLVYCTPSHQFPTGVPMSLRRRRDLLAWAQANDAGVLEDDYDSEFRFTGRPLEPLHTLDEGGRVIYAGSFSKSLLPSLRTGFLVPPPSLRPALIAARQLTDWHGPTVIQAALGRFIDDGLLARHLRHAAAEYRRRRDAVLAGMHDRLGELFQVLPSAAGLHVCARQRPGAALDMPALAAAAAERGIVVETLGQHAVGAAQSAERSADGLVLGYGIVRPDSIATGLSELADLAGRRRRDQRS